MLEIKSTARSTFQRKGLKSLMKMLTPIGKNSIDCMEIKN